MATQITTLTAGYILIQAGHGLPNHVAPKGSQFTDVDTAILYFNKNGLNEWEQNIDVANSGSTIGINTFSSFSSSTIGQGSVIATTTSDNLTFSGINLSILVDNTNKILTLSALTPSNYTFTGGTVNGLTNFTSGLSATTISATTFYGNGSHLTGISTQDTYLTGGTYSNGTATFTNNTGGTFTVTGFKTTEIFVTGGTYSNGTTIFTNNTGGTFTVTGYYTGYTAPIDVRVTGGTYSAGSILFTNNTGGTFNVTGLYTGYTAPIDVRVTGGTYSNGTATFTNNTGGTFNVSGFKTDDIYTTGMTFNTSNYNLSITRNDGTSFSQSLAVLASDMTVTGGTYNPNSGVATFTNNTGGTFSVSGFLTGQTDTYVTGLTFNNNTLTLKQTNNQADINILINNLSGLTVNGTVSATTISATTFYGNGANLTGISTRDTYVTGGTYSNSTGITTFTNNTGGTFNVSGYYTGYTTPIDIRVTGGTYSNGTATFTNNTGGTFTVTGFNTSTQFTGGTVTGATNFTNGLSANTISATTYYNLPVSTDVRVTGGTYSAGSILFTNNTGGTFSVTGLYTGYTDTNSYFSAVTYTSNTLTFTNSTGGTSNVVINNLTGLTVNGNTTVSNGLVRVQGSSSNELVRITQLGSGNALIVEDSTNPDVSPFVINASGDTAIGLLTPLNGDKLTVSGNTTVYGSLIGTTISATTYYNLPVNTDVRVTGGTYSSGTATFTNNTGGTFTVTGFSTGGGSTFTGGTVNGATNFTAGLTANTISATTYYNLPVSTDVRVTGGTYSNGTTTFTNNTGGTFNVTGYYTGYTAPVDIRVTGGTYSNGTILFTNNTGGTFNVTGLYTGYTAPVDVTVTGGTYSNGTTTFTNNTGGTFSVSGYYTGYTDIDVYLTGASYNNNTFTFTNSTGGTSNVLVNTMTGLTISGNISASTVNIVNYIDFSTGSTSPSNVSGRVYYDNQSHALAYYPDINQNVKVEMGQQLYIRGFNNTGSIILKGSVLTIQSATNGLPNFTLAVNTHRGFSQVIGLAASDIPINGNGLALSQGILSGITINSFNVGDVLYASPFSAGTYVASTDTFPFTARTNQVGFVIATGTTTGEIYVSINNEDENLTLTDIERNILEGNVVSTGTYEFTGMTTASTTTFNIAPMRGWLVENTYEYATSPDVINIYYTGGTNISLTNIASADSTYILITSALTVTQQVTFPTPQQRRENIYLGKVNHPNRTSILNINNTVDYDVSPMSALRDLWSPIKLINQGIIPSPNGANLSFNTSAGTLWGNGINWVNNQLSPNNVNIAAKVPASFSYRTQTGGTSTSVTVIDPTKYDVGGVITTITPAGSNDATNQRIYIYPTGVINVLYGQTRYATLAEAIANIQSETFIPYPNADANGILIGVISVRNDIVADGQPLTNTDYAKFTLVSKFGESFGGTGGLSTTTLQQAYNNSTTPEIVINSTLGGLSIQNGTGNADNTTRLLEGLNAAGNITSFIRADGYISGTTFQSNGFVANTDGMTATTVSATTLITPSFRTNNGGITATTVSATTYYNLPTDVRVTGGTYSNNTFTFTNNTGGTFNTLFNTMTGLTINGDLIVSANTQSWFSGNSASDLVRITQTGAGNALVVEDSTNPDISQFVVDNTGNVGIGTNTPIAKLQISNTATTVSSALYTSDFIILTAEGTAPGMNIISAGDTSSYRGVFKATRSRGTLNSPTLPQSGDGTFSLLGAVYDGVTNLSTAGIQMEVDGSVTANTAPQRIIFATTTGSSRTERMRITSDGKVGIGMTPTAQLSVKATAVPSAGESIASFQVSDASGTFSIQNYSNSDAVFVPSLVGNQASGANQIALNLTSYIYPSDDTGTNPLMTFRSATNALTGVTTRPLFDFRNWSTSVMLLAANGNVGIGTTSPSTNLHVTGSTLIGGTLSATTVSATTYLNLPTDIRVTGATYSNNTFTFTNNTGGTFNTLFNTVTGLTVNGNISVTGTSVLNTLTATTISATTYFNLPTDVRLTGGTYNAGTATFTNNTGGTFTVSGFISNDTFVTGGTYSNGTATFTNSTGGTFNVTGFSTGSGTFTGGTVTGPTTFTNGLSANTISATTYYNLPIDIRVTGGTYSNGTATFTNNTGGTFTVTGFSTSGGSGSDTYVTGATYSNNTFTFKNNSGNTFNVLFNTVTGLTVNGNITVTGNTYLQAFTGISATISGAGQSILTVIGSGTSTTSPLFSVVGTQGELFSVSDSLTGSLFSVNDISGLPVIEVFSDNTILMGSYQAPSLNTTTKVVLTAGTNTVYSIPTSGYTGAFFDYTVISTGSTGARAGNIMAIWSGSTVQYSETSTNDIGTTAGITFSVAISGSFAVLSSSATTAGWTLKTIVRSI